MAGSDTVKGYAVQHVHPSALTVNPRNPRRIQPARMEQLKKALAADPDMLHARPLIALPDGTVIAGNQRLTAILDLGWESVPVVYADLDPARATEWMLRDNRGFGDDDVDATAALLAELSEQGRDLDMTGFSSLAIDQMLRATRRTDRDPDEAPPAPAKPKSKVGDVYPLGSHRLMCGDSADEEHLATLMGDDLADLILTDPPYGVAYVGGTKDKLTLRNDDLTPAALRVLLLECFTKAGRYARKGAVWYVFAPSGVDYRIPLNILSDLGIARHGLVWVKDRFVMGRADYHYRHENIIYGWTPGGSHRGLEERTHDTVLEYPRPAASREHPTMKPAEMLADLIAVSSARGECVLDPFGGSGSTLIAAETLGRTCCTMEVDTAYCDVIRQRYADFTGQPEYAP